MPPAGTAPLTLRGSGTDAGDRSGYALRDVAVAVDGRTLLEVPELTIASRAVCGLIGHNGSGKTTLLRLLARQRRADTGSIRFENRPLSEWGSRAFARRVGYLPQQLPVVTGLTVRELVAFGRYPWHGALGRFGPADRTAVTEALHVTGLTELHARLVDTLSGGERQRVWLAMLLAQQAACLLLDEPITALDVAHQIDVMALVQRLSREQGLAVVVVLHDVNLAARFCDRIVALHSGRVIVDASPGDLMRGDLLEAIFGVRMGVLQHPTRGTPISFVR